MWEKERSRQLGMVMLSIGAVYLFLQYLAPVLAPGLIAMIFSMITGPFLHRLQKKYHIRRAIGVTIILVFILILLVGGLLFLGVHLIGEIPKWLQQVEEFWQQLDHFPTDAGIFHYFGLSEVTGKELIGAVWNEGKGQLLQMLGNGVMSNSVKYAEKAGKVLFFLLITVISVVLLADRYDSFMGRLLEKTEYFSLLSVMCEVVRYIATWVKAQGVILPLISGMCAGVMFLLGIENALFLGLLAGCLDVLPMIGTGFVLGPQMIFLCLHQQYGKAVLLLLLYLGCVLVRQTLEPRIIGKGMGIPTLALVLSIYGGISLFGVMGIWKGPLGYLIVQAMWRVRTPESLQRRG